MGEKAGSGRGAWDKRDAPARCQGGQRSGQAPSSKDSPGAGEALNSGCVPVPSPPSLTGPGLCPEFSARPAAWDPDTPDQRLPGASRTGAWGQARIPHLGGGNVGTEHGFTGWERPHSPSEHPSSAPHVTLILLPCPHTARQCDSRRSQGGDSRALASAGQGMLEELWRGGDSVSGSPQGPCAGPALRCQH